MSDNVPMTDTELIQEVRRILDVEEWPSDAVRKVRRLLANPFHQPEPEPVEHTDRGWPVLRPSSGVVDLPDSRWLDTGSQAGYAPGGDQVDDVDDSQDDR